MSDRKDEKLNNGDLREIKSLIGDADSGGFSLDSAKLPRNFGIRGAP